MLRIAQSLVVVAVFATALSSIVRGEDLVPREPTPDEAKFFENHVRPVLANHCYRCHGPERQRGELRVDSLGALLAGGESGPSIVLGKPDESLMIEAIHYDPFSYQMPPTGKLEDKDVKALTRWVEIGAPWPGATQEQPVATRPKEKITDEDRAFWAFQPLANPEAPRVDDQGWSLTPIDQFIFRALTEAGLDPAEPADPRQLIRRVYFDLIGLPPESAVVERFAADPTPEAYAKIVDELLDNPRYGERWARHWLDLARYAESDGWRQDGYRPHAWRYRDYVIRSFNEDKPYDRFVQEQLAGDEIAPDDPDALIATGFLRHSIYEYNQRDAVTQWTEIMTDVTDTTADVFLGLGMGCARCHDHKFDPILQKDYFALQAFLAPMVWRDDVPPVTPEDLAEYESQLNEWYEATTELRAEIDAIEAPFIKRAIDTAVNKFPDDVIAMIRKPAADQTPYEAQVAALALRQADFEIGRANISGKLKDEKKETYERLQAELKKFDHLKPRALPVAMTVADVGPHPPTVTIPGSRSAEPIEPGFLTVMGQEPPTIVPPEGLDSTGRRSALAHWLTQPDHPLVTRVIVNRIWKYHFGTGIVATTSDFGRLGEEPSHPELLDWMARRFVADGWSFKRMHRLILTSRVYQQSALRETPETAAMKDPTNRLLWRMNTRRLDADQIRDAMLATSGELRERTGGPAVDHNQPVRTVYTRVVRNTRDPLLDVFDYPMGFTSTPERNTTTTPTQALLMINGQWTLARAAAFARRLGKLSDPEVQVHTAFELALGRAPTPRELTMSVEFLKQGSETDPQPPVELAKFPVRGTQAARMVEASNAPLLSVPDRADLPSGDFTIEAYVQLDSLYNSATVRTIAAQWDGDNKKPGWSLGVTSTKSSYKPRNLIVQLTGNDAEGKQTYEVIASNLHLELKKPYYVAASVRLAEDGPGSVTFFARRLDGEHPVESAEVPHPIAEGYRNNLPFTLGGRATSPQHRWNGLVDEVRLSSVALNAEDLLIHRGAGRDVVGAWSFQSPEALLTDASGRQAHLVPLVHGQTAGGPSAEALIDFCHVLLNSNEFLYVD